MRVKRGVLIGIVLLIVVVLMGVGFFYTGGVGLVRLYQNYLSQDIPDKKYTWQDFTDRGATTKLSGYYAGRVGESIFVWTLGGLRRFGYEQGKSVYYYMDVCGIIRGMAEARENRSNEGKNDQTSYSPAVSFDPMSFAVQMKRGDYVAVVRTDERPSIVSQLYGSSNQYFPLTELRAEQCAK